MQFSELKNIFLAHTGLNDGDIEDSIISIWMNEAQRDLAYECGEQAAESYEGAQPIEGWAMPDNCLKIIDGDRDFYINNLGRIVFTAGGGGVIYYRKYPTSFTGAHLDESDLPEAVQHLLPIFAAARYWDRESEGDTEEMNLSTKWMNYYQMGKATAIRNLSQAGCGLQKWTIAEE